MGGSEPDCQPQFRIEIRSLYISKNPITNLEFEAFDSNHERGPASVGDDHPVTNVSFHQATAYARWYSEQSGKAFRLPTEAEWEFACRAGTTTRYFWGDSPPEGDRYLWDARTSDGCCRRVEAAPANNAGLHDMLGNVWEWTSSLHRPYPIQEGDGRDDVDAEGSRVVRGGSFRTDRTEIGSASRRSRDPNERSDDLGFRIARFL